MDNDVKNNGVFVTKLANAEVLEKNAESAPYRNWTAGEWVVNKVTTKPKPSFHSPERQARFDKWSKEDWLKDDPYACMWDRNWIRKYKQDVCL